MEPNATQRHQRRPLKTSVQLARAAWRVVKLDKELLGISALNMAANMLIFLAIVVGFVVYFWRTGGFAFTSSDAATSAHAAIPHWAYWIGVAAVALITYTLTNFFNGAITHAALRRFDGNDPTFREAMAAARAKAGPLMALAGLQATVGLVLNILQDRLPFVGKLATWLAGAAWGVATMFALPVVMQGNEKNPLKVVKQSAQIFTGIWQESVFVGLSLGVLSIVATLLMVFVVIGLFALAIALSSLLIALLGVLILIIMVLGFSLLYNALHAVVIAAAYYYATTGRVPAGFDEELVRAMFRPKRKWLGV